MKRARTVVLIAAFLSITSLAAALLPPAPALPGPVPALPLPADGFDGCPAGAATRYYDVWAVNVPISYNHWGDYDPNGTVFVLRDEAPLMLAQVGQALAEAGLATAFAVVTDPTHAAGTLGYVPPFNLRNFPTTAPLDVSPLVQPLVVRAKLGECVQFNLTNLLTSSDTSNALHIHASIHVHGVRSAPGAGMDFGNDGSDLTPPLGTRSYRVFVPDEPGMEGAHLLHSHADARYQTKHGLFGALVAEPSDADWRAPDGGPGRSGTQAIVTRPAAADFREFVTIYHDEVELVDRHNSPLPTVSQYGEYAPGSKAINMRTEPFMDRFEHHDALFAANKLPREHDKSQGYGSYTYGDPGIFIPRSYVGDPAKWRLVNAGPGQHHVHHLHGGGDRWRASPVSDDTQFDDGFLKTNPVLQSKSERIDVQVIGPGESFNAEIEGGSGGVQQSVGDFLFHCHIAEHYVAGMFSFWRVHNTLQDDLAPLPDRVGQVVNATNSTGLVGTALPDGTVLNATNLPGWVEPQLPPPGDAPDDDAATWDWLRQDRPAGPLYLGEPETAHVWPNYESPTPGERPEILFNPLNGRLAYPLLRPHLGERPPFANEHGPAPYLTNDVDARHPDGLCPAGAPPRDYKVVAMQVHVPYNGHGDVDRDGAIFAHAADKAAIQNGSKDAKSLVLRANQGDCVDVLLTSQLNETDENGHHSKVNMHIHLVQFDVQGSDGVISGLNFETSVRPATSTGSGLASAASAGATTLTVDDGTRIRNGTLVGVGLTQTNVEFRTVTAVAGNLITLDAALSGAHATGERVGTEFVRYRWYPDVDLGIVYWHDHVDGLNSWRHGLFGSIIIEPAGSGWKDPKDHSAADRLDGHVLDIVGPNGTFREFVVQFQERSACLHPGTDAERREVCTIFPAPPGLPPILNPPNPKWELASFNLRAEPFLERNTTYPLLSGVPNATDPSQNQGLPATDLWRAYPGDNVTIRIVFTGQSNNRAVGTFGVTGHRFPFEWNNPGSRLQDAVSIGISSQHNLRLDCGAGGCAKQPGDYLYYMTQPDLFSRGAWGVLRVHDTTQGDLETLSTNANWAAGALPTGTVRHYDVVALETDVVLNQETGLVEHLKLFAPAADEAAILGGQRPEPLVVRALPGDVVEVNLTNHLTTDRVSLAPGLVLASPADGLGIPVGDNADTTIAPNTNRTYRFVADKEVGAAYLTSFGRPAQHPGAGLYGALVVEPAGSTPSPWTGASATLNLSDGSAAREHVLVYVTEDGIFESSVMPYTVDAVGPAVVNYRSESLNDRVGNLGVHSCDTDDFNCLQDPLPFGLGGGKQVRWEHRNVDNPLAFNSTRFGDPETPILDAAAGQKLVVRALTGGGDQLVTHTLSGHWWRRDPAMAGSNLVDTETMGPREASNAWLLAGPGGAGDYYWGTHRFAFQEQGAWGILRVV